MINKNLINEYSTEEKIVGKWIDGRELYQKTISCGALPNNGTKEVSIGIDLKQYEIVNIFGTATRPYQSSQNALTYPLPYVNFEGYDVSIAVLDNNNNVGVIRLITRSDRSLYTHTYVTIQYIKI